MQAGAIYVILAVLSMVDPQVVSILDHISPSGIGPDGPLFDEATIQDRPDLRWSPYHGRRMRARVAAFVADGEHRGMDDSKVPPAWCAQAG